MVWAVSVRRPVSDGRSARTGSSGGGGAGTGFAGGGAGTVGGFIGLLQQLQQLRNTEDSLALQINQLAKLESYHAAGLITLIQVDNLRQAVETEKATLLQSQNSFQATLDNFKVNTMGLPPDLPVALDDSLIRQFQFLDPRATAIGQAWSHLRSAVGSSAGPAVARAVEDGRRRSTRHRAGIGCSFPGASTTTTRRSTSELPRDCCP